MEGVFALMIPILAIGLAWFATFLKHKEKMAGVGKYGVGDPALRQTVQMLTETLEKQHDRQQALVKRIESLESIVTSERLPEPPLALGLDDEDAPPAREPATEPIRPRVRL